MFKLHCNCTHLTGFQSYAQKPSSYTLSVHEPRTSRLKSWIQKRQRNQSWITEKAQEIQKKTCTSASLTIIKPLTSVKRESETLSCVQLCDPMDCIQPSGLLCHQIIQARIWSGQLFPSPGDLLNPGMEPRSPTLQEDYLPSGQCGSQQTMENT